MDIDLHGLRSRWPTIRRAGAPAVPVDPARSTVLDRTPGTESARRADTGPDSPARFLQILVESISGKPLSSFFPVAQGIPKIIGVDGLQNATDFQSFLEGFNQAMQFFVMPAAPVVRQDDDTHRRLRASALGVRDAGAVRKATPRPIRRFDEFMAMLPPDPATLAAALQAGASDGIPIGFGEAISAFVGALRAAIFANDTGALLNLGQDFGALLVVLHGAINGGEGVERSARGGMVLVKKGGEYTSRARIVAVEMGGAEFVVDPRTGKNVLKRKRRA